MNLEASVLLSWNHYNALLTLNTREIANWDTYRNRQTAKVHLAIVEEHCKIMK